VFRRTDFSVPEGKSKAFTTGDTEDLRGNRTGIDTQSWQALAIGIRTS
jgi:hypothetical protein